MGGIGSKLCIATELSEEESVQPSGVAAVYLVEIFLFCSFPKRGEPLPSLEIEQ